MSMSTGSVERSTSAAKVASVTLIAFRGMGSGVWQRPHTGSSPAWSFSLGTRLVAPQALQRINCGSVMSPSELHLRCQTFV